MEINKNEAVCVARHLIAQHRQDLFKREATITEACIECSINTICYGKKSEVKGSLWHDIYPRICKEAGLKCGFMRGVYPLVPYEKKDNQ